METIKSNLKITEHLEVDKNLQANGNGYIFGNLEVNGSLGTDKLGIGTSTPQASLQITNASQDGTSLIIGNTNQSNLRLGYHEDYSWIQAHGNKPLIINPQGFYVGIGTLNPKSPLTVGGIMESSNGGFKFPDGSIQKKASETIKMRSGFIAINKTKKGESSPLIKEGEQKTYSEIIKLTGFTRTPQVMWSIANINADDGSNLRLKVKVHRVNRTSLQFSFYKWHKTKIYFFDIKWLAIGT